MELGKGETERGFNFYEFEDSNGVKCSIQKSSSVEDKIWLGADQIGVQSFMPSHGWQGINLEELLGTNQIVANNRMHLSREQVATLLPLLEVFVETGELP